MFRFKKCIRWSQVFILERPIVEPPLARTMCYCCIELAILEYKAVIPFLSSTSWTPSLTLLGHLQLIYIYIYIPQSPYYKKQVEEDQYFYRERIPEAVSHAGEVENRKKKYRFGKMFGLYSIFLDILSPSCADFCWKIW